MTVAAPRAAEPARAEVPDDPLDLVPTTAVVAVAMSGGVDSSVAAARCVARGLRAFGITLAMWPRNTERDRDRGCCSVDAVEDARRVATTLGIPHYSWNLEPEFQAEVVSMFGDEYAAGRTPNPCVRCNQTVKFGALLSRALQAGATHLATGHYARSGRRGEAITLHRAAATTKDQAYTLHRLDQRQLRHAVFPLGSFTSKGEVRHVAAGLGLVTASKPDSQELCFVTDTVRSDLARRLAGRFSPGAVLDTVGNIVGEHRGVPFYTVGQRSGIAVAPTRPDTAPLYVVAVDAGNNTITVGPRTALERTVVKLEDVRWIDVAAPRGAVLTLQLRAHATPAPVTVAKAASGSMVLACHSPVTQVAPGQAGVVYDGDEVVGGGVVTS
jgi:tRNA-uridine 2-sulfurtransferase